ncbi:hypothetical protein [Rhodocyclus purpureus]|uniref:hypothetical protein n=1 Tax=Rhodocyclus purpureus TaxID=1067 RepID=UPI001912E681|nr:hypothetical protein [Rhodocyclus purpureus]
MIRLRRLLLRARLMYACLETDLARDRLRRCGQALVENQDRERALSERLARINAQADAWWRARQC